VGATVKIPCDPGMYCNANLLIAPVGNCNAGYYCTSGATTNTPTNDATQGGNVCPAGSYCEAGTQTPVPCSPGSYRSSTGGTSSASCTTCPAGKYCSTFGGTSFSGNCAAGYYCPAGSTVAKQNICQAGYYCPSGDALSPIACADPNYQDIKGQSSCKTCGAGYECTSTARTLCRPDQSSLSYYCPNNQYSRVSCSVGTFTDVIGAETQGDCANCPAGYYCPNSASLSKIVECPAGFYCTGGAYTADATAGNTLNCSDGYYCPSGSSMQVPCTPGKYCSGANLQSVTGDCNAGYFCVEGSNTATPSGTYPNSGSCPAGSYCVAGSPIFIECPLGTFNPNAGATHLDNCTICTAGKKCLSRGLTAVSTNCPAGYYCTQNPFLQRACEEGNYCPSGVDAQVQCSSGQYNPYTLQAT
jgi:hypothetical protein